MHVMCTHKTDQPSWSTSVSRRQKTVDSQAKPGGGLVGKQRLKQGRACSLSSHFNMAAFPCASTTNSKTPTYLPLMHCCRSWGKHGRKPHCRATVFSSFSISDPPGVLSTSVGLWILLTRPHLRYCKLPERKHGPHKGVINKHLDCSCRSEDS